MIADTERLERRSLARSLKIFLDLLFYLTLGVAIVLVGSLGISTFTDYDEGWDFIVPTNLGEGAFFSPSFSVEFESHPPPQFESVRLGAARENSIFSTTTSPYIWSWQRSTWLPSA
jgi:hypothetical protein